MTDDELKSAFAAHWGLGRSEDDGSMEQSCWDDGLLAFAAGVAAERERWADAMRAVMCSDVGTQVRHKLETGQGTDTPDGRAWLAALRMLDQSPNVTNNRIPTAPQD